MLQFSALLLMSTILTFVMDSDGLFLCSLTHICGVQMVITLCPKPNKMPPVLSLMALEKKISKENRECTHSEHQQLWLHKGH